MAGGSIARHRDGLCCSYAGKGGGPGAGSDDVTIHGPVGRGAQDVGPDVLRIQQALNLIPQRLGGPPGLLVEDGAAGPATLDAIEAFQRRHFGLADGRIDVLGRTHGKISSLQPAKLVRMIMAERFLKDALGCIQAAQAVLLSAGAELLTGGGFFGTFNLDLADAHFAVTKAADPGLALTQLGAVYTAMLAFFTRPGGIWGWHAFEAEPFTNRNFFAFTYCGGWYLTGRYAGWQRLDSVYLSAFYDRGSDDDRVQTIVHELAHFVGPTGLDRIADYGYGQRTAAALQRLTPYQKRHNAETFGNFAFEAKFARPPQANGE